VSALALVDTSLERFDQEEIDSEKIAAEQRILARGKKILEIEEILKIQFEQDQLSFLTDETNEHPLEKSNEKFLILQKTFNAIPPFPKESLDAWIDRCQKIQDSQKKEGSASLTSH